MKSLTNKIQENFFDNINTSSKVNDVKSLNKLTNYIKSWKEHNPKEAEKFFTDEDGFSKMNKYLKSILDKIKNPYVIEFDARNVYVDQRKPIHFKFIMNPDGVGSMQNSNTNITARYTFKEMMITIPSYMYSEAKAKNNVMFDTIKCELL